MESFKRQFARAFWFALAVILLFESWLWDHVKEWLRALGRVLGVERFEEWLAGFVGRLSPPATLAVFAVPFLGVLPLKVVGVEFIAHGRVMAGVAVLFSAKTLALGVTAFLFDHCREKLLQMPWFARFYSLVLDARVWARELVAPLRSRLRAAMANVKALLAARLAAVLAAFLAQDRRRSRFLRRLADLRAFARRNRAAP
jgi:hypothetical protein